jgi:fused signal recognition particle receptor
MFGFLKKKIKEGISKLTGKIEEEPVEEKVSEVEEVVEPVVEPVEEAPVVEEKVEEKTPEVEEKVEVITPGPVEREQTEVVKPSVIGEGVTEDDVDELLVEEKVEEAPKEEVVDEPVVEDKVEEVIPEPVVEEVVEETPVEEKVEEPVEEKKGFFKKLTAGLAKKVTTTTISQDKFEDLFQELEMSMLENNVAVEVIDKIKEDLSKVLVEQPLKRTKIEETIRETLKTSISDVLSVDSIDLLAKISEKKPYVICFVGINGSGKTTSIAKVAHMLKEQGKNVVLAAGDTFRAASIHQLQEHADKIDVKLIKHDYGSDPAAVAFDAIKHAKAKDADVVLIDTAGRMQNNDNLMAELKKIIRVATPDLKIYVGEAIAGNDCVEQVQQFNSAVGIDGIILTKADVDEKGGAMISASYVSGKPILYLGVGQEYSQLEAFDSEKVLARLEL